MSRIRKAVIIYDEQSAMTLLKPLSAEYKDQLIVLHEDAYGTLHSKVQPISEIRRFFNGDAEEFEEILREL